MAYHARTKEIPPARPKRNGNILPEAPMGENIHGETTTGRGDLANFADRNTVFAWSDRDIDDGYPESSPVGCFPSWELARSE